MDEAKVNQADSPEPGSGASADGNGRGRYAVQVANDASAEAKTPDSSSPAAEATAGEAEKAKEKIGTFHSLRFEGFRLLWLGTLFTSTANWVQQSTLGWVVYDLTGSGSLLGGIQGIRAVPTLIMMPFTGVMVDRFSRRTLMVHSQIPLIFLNAGLALGLLFGKVEIWHLFVFVFLSGIAMAVNQPARQTAPFDLVPREVVPNAVALNQTAFAVTRALGPGGAAFLLAWSGAAGNFFIQAAAYVGVTVTTMMIVFPPKKLRANERSFFHDSWEGFKYVGREPLARMLMLISMVAPMLIIPTLNTLMPVFSKSIYHTGAVGFGILIMGVGFGNLGGALFTASLGNFERRSLVQMSSLFITSLALFAFAFAPNIYVAVPLLFVCGFAQMIFLPTNQTLLQLSVPDDMRGRITSILLLGPLLIPLGSLLVGVGTDAIGAQVVVAISGAAAAVISVLIWLLSPTIREIRLSELESAHAVK